MKRRSIATHLPKLRAAAFAPLTVLLGMPLAHAATNLNLANGTFDAGTGNWVIVGNASAIAGQTTCGATKCLQMNIDKAMVTATSEVKAVSPGQFIAASAMMKRASIVGDEDVSLGIMFYGPNGVLIGEATRWSSLAGPANTWSDVKVSAIAPTGAETAKVVIRGNSTSTLTAYVDNVVMSKIILEDKGHQIFVGRVSAAAIDSNTLYVAANGNPAKFAYYRVSDGGLINEFTLGNEEIWSVVVGGDSAAYFGTASGKFYRFAYTTDAAPVLKKEFKNAAGGTRTIWSLKTGPGNCIYGGLAPDGTKTEGFKYCGGTGEPTLLTLPTNNGVTATGYHVRSLALDPGDSGNPSSVFWGMGNPSRLHKSAVDGTGLSAPLAIDATKEYAYYTDFAKNRVFVRLTGTSFNQTVVLDRSGTSVGNPVENINSLGISSLSPSGDTVFYTKALSNGTHLSSYRVDNGSETTLALQMSASAAFGYAPYSAPTQLVSVLREPENGDGKILRYNLADLYKADNSVKPVTTVFPPPATASGIRTFAVHNGKTYSAGFVNGAIGISDGTSKPPVLVKEYLQAEGMAILGNNLYIGGYPGAVLKSFPLTADGLLGPALPADKTLGDSYGQNRPFAMLALPGKTTGDIDRLVIATVPKKDEQGALAMYSVGERFPWTVVKEPFTGQSILALARIDDFVYGGTSVWRDIDNVKSTGSAKLFRFEPFKSLAVTEVPFDNAIVNSPSNWDKKVISALLAVNRQIWALAEDTVVIYDHDTRQFVKRLQIAPGFKYDEFKIVWNGGSMVQSNGYVYISATDTKLTNIYRVNISKPDSVELVRSGASGMLKVDAKGDVYFVNEEKIMKFNMALP